MADHELRLNVSAPGAVQTAKEVQAVGAAAAGVVAPTTAAAGATDKKASKDALGTLAARSHRASIRELSGALRMLGPEFNIVTDTMLQMATGGGKAALGMGGLLIAAYGVVEIMKVLGASGKAREEQAKALAENLKEEAKAYDEIALAIEKVIISRTRERGGTVGQGPDTEEAVTRAAQRSLLAAGVGSALVGKTGIEQVAAAITPTTTDEEIDTMELLARLGYVKELGLEDHADLRAYAKGISASGRIQLKKEMAFVQKRFPTVGRGYRGEARGLLGALSPAGKAAAAAVQMSKETGKPAAEVEQEVRFLVSQYVNRHPEDREEVGNLLDRMLAQYPELGNLEYGPMGGPRGVIPAMTNMRVGDIYAAAQGGAGSGEIRPSAVPGAGAGGFFSNVFNGGTHYHGQLLDPSGQRNLEASR